MENSAASPLQPYSEGDAATGIRTLSVMWYDEFFFFLITSDQPSSDCL